MSVLSALGPVYGNVRSAGAKSITVCPLFYRREIHLTGDIMLALKSFDISYM